MWEKKGLVFDVGPWRTDRLRSHASIPFAFHVEGDLFRIFFSSRDGEGRSLPYCVPAEITGGTIRPQGPPVGPLAELGALGTFDDSGVMPTCVLRHGGTVSMYYIGWNPQVTVPYRLAVGLMTSDDDGRTFRRHGPGPVLDRNLDEPFFSTAPYVLVEDGVWRMWYIGCTGWTVIDGRPEPRYHVKYAESADGVRWRRDGVVCLDYDERAEALGRPCVIRQDGLYKMYFSYRSVTGYRTTAGSGYRIGLAVSANGTDWQKRYDDTGIDLSPRGWDSVMMEYCHVFRHAGHHYMLYNGNDFGREGFGYAVTQRP
mgnify:CR=1 FL=1